MLWCMAGADSVDVACCCKMLFAACTGMRATILPVAAQSWLSSELHQDGVASQDDAGSFMGDATPFTSRLVDGATVVAATVVATVVATAVVAGGTEQVTFR
eukprot:CAMPEP_0172935912 /NCGR_PEP_ID=MMETSP1075-20121228/221755_1 /TAXON_ID=2916 /ORGANISM="Ceratium fusus, Strain PA161109" /LENGTH=100 /DNA_ID=CAMNT_0013797275 /DNA_START=393 /DNA_END=696 /DNA_ORIENTATION=-